MLLCLCGIRSVAQVREHHANIQASDRLLALFCRLVDALYLFLPANPSQHGQEQPKTSLLSLLVLIKGVIKAAILLKANKKAVKQLVLTPNTARADSWGPLNVLQVGSAHRWDRISCSKPDSACVLFSCLVFFNILFKQNWSVSSPCHVLAGEWIARILAC